MTYKRVPPEERIVKRRKKTGHTKPPLPGGFSTKNSHTSPKRIAERKRQAEALTLRAAGASYASIGEHLKVNASAACKLVFKAMDRLIPAEVPERVRTLELTRLDAVQSKIWKNCVNGSIASIHAFLRIQDMRARLLGLYPAAGQQVQIGVAGNDAPIDLHINFVTPRKKLEPVLDVSPSPYPPDTPSDYSRPALPPPPQRTRGPLGLWTEEKPTSWMK
jgi:hypothetical protein